MLRHLGTVREEDGYNKQNSLMIEPSKEVCSLHKPRNINKWTVQEILDLKKIVVEVDPQNNSEWKEVCLRMHSQNSRRRPCDYKAKFLNELSKQERKDFIEDKQIEKDIYTLFEEGKSPCVIARTLGDVQVKSVVEILNRLFDKINRILVKVLGGNKMLKPKDFRLWKWMKENSVEDVERLEEIQMLCVWLKQLKRPQSEFRKKNFKSYDKIRREVEQKLRKFNKTLELCSNQLVLTDKGIQITGQLEQVRPRLIKNQVIKTQSIPMLHLKSVSEFPEQFKPYSSLFSEENLNKMDESLDKFLNAGLKTSINLQEQCPNRQIDENTQLYQHHQAREDRSFRDCFQHSNEGYNDGEMPSQNDFF